MITLGSISWGSSPKIPITFEYEKQRSGADMQYRVKVTVSALTGTSTFGYPIYFEYAIAGTTVGTVTLKNASPNQWSSAITHTSAWYTVSNKFSDTTAVEFKVYSGSGSSRNSSYNYAMAVDPAVSTVSAPSGTLSTSLNLTVTRYNSSFTHTITYSCGSTSGTVCTKSSATTVAWDNTNGNVSGLAIHNTEGRTLTVTFTITTYSGSSVIGTSTTRVYMTIPYDVKPYLTMGLEDAAGYFSTYGAYIQGKSKLKITVTPTLAYNSPIKSYSIKADGKVYTTASVTTEPLQLVDQQIVFAMVTDARGHFNSTTSTITVLPYTKPSVDVTAYRCDANGNANSEGSYMKMGFTSTISSLGGKNSARYTISGGGVTRTGTGTSYTSEAIACDVSKAWTVTVTVSDNLDTTTGTVAIPIAFTLMDFHNSGAGVALGKVATREGFDCAMPAYFTGGVNVGGKSLLDLIYPVGSIYMSANNVSPQSFFGGTWTQIQDRFLLGAGSTYSAGGTGGSATHTLTVNEMPTHSHVMKVSTQGSTASDASWRAAGQKSYSNYLTDTSADNVKDTGGNAAHNNMPPYLVVYMWKRTA